MGAEGYNVTETSGCRPAFVSAWCPSNWLALIGVSRQASNRPGGIFLDDLRCLTDLDKSVFLKCKAWHFRYKELRTINDETDSKKMR